MSTRRPAMARAVLVAAIVTLALPAGAGAFVYWGNADLGAGTTIGRADLDGSGANPGFISAGRFPAGIAVDGQHIYWTNQAAGTIGRASLYGTAVNRFFMTGIDTPFGVAADGRHIYWTDGSGEIGRANLDGTGVEPSFIATGDAHPFGVAVDAEHVYWTNLIADTIGRASLDGSSADPGFITGPSTPVGLAVDSLPYATATAVACSPAGVTVPASTSCTATVGDTAAAPSAPTGTVAFRSTGGGSFGSPASCSLVAGPRSTCRITYTPSAAGAATITAAYSGDATNAASKGTASLGVRGPSNSFPLSRPKLDKRRGTATLTARIPGPGRLVLRGEGLERNTRNASGAGSFKLTVRPRHRMRHRLERTGRATVKAKVSYTPHGGDARTKSKRMTLKLTRRR
jgi:hypothetical protein